MTRTLAQIPVRIEKLTALFSFFLLLAVSRGPLQLILGKKLAMIAQFGGLIGLSTVIFGHLTIRPKQKWLLILTLLFISVSFLSCLVTFTKNESLIWIIYVMFNCGLLWIALLTVRDFDLKELPYSIAPVILFVGWYLFGVATLEQLELIKMSGSGRMFVVRPASVTGSFLHYPILIALIGFICIQWYSLTKKIHYLASGTLFCLSPFASASRSGALIVLAALMIFPFLIPFKRSKRVLVLTGFFFLLIFASFFLFPKADKSSVIHNLIYRVVSSTNSKSIGNNVRVAIWKNVTDKWLDTNLLIGEEAGEYTNSSNNMKAKKKLNLNTSKVTESSPLQLLLNFGLLGAFLFYGILAQIPRFIL